MKITHDSKVDMAYIKLESGKQSSSRELNGGVVVDETKDGKILGFEIYDASKRIPQFIKQITKNKLLNVSVSK